MKRVNKAENSGMNTENFNTCEVVFGWFLICLVNFIFQSLV